MRSVSDVAFMLGLVFLVVGAVTQVVTSGHFDVLWRRRHGEAAAAPRRARQPRSRPWFLAGGGLVVVAVVAAALARV